MINGADLLIDSGSGYEPAFIGYTGKNMLDAVAVGELFSSPTAKSFYDAIREADGGRGIICLYGNYAGDNMNVKMATKLAAKDGIEVATVIANDDVCSAPAHEREKRRTIAAGKPFGEARDALVAAAEAGRDSTRDLVARIGRASRLGKRSLGVLDAGTASCAIILKELSRGAQSRLQ